MAKRFQIIRKDSRQPFPGIVQIVKTKKQAVKAINREVATCSRSRVYLSADAVANTVVVKFFDTASMQKFAFSFWFDEIEVR